MMKALYFSIFYMLFVFVAFSQEQESRFTKIKSATTEYENVLPDGKFHWTTNDEPEWNTTESKYFRFYNLNSGMYAIRSGEGYCKVYTFYTEENKFHNEDLVHSGNVGAKDYDPKYPPLMFEYAGNVYVFEYGRSIDELHFVQHHTDNIVDWDDNTWHKDKDLNEHDDDFRIYRAACNINDTLYMVYDQTGDSQGNGVGDGCEIRIAKCTMDDKHELVQHQLFKLEDVMKLGNFDEEYLYHPMAATSFVHPDGLPRMIISFSGADDGVNNSENFGGGVFVFNPQTGEVEDWLYSNADYAMDVRAVCGSMQAGRDFAKGGTLNGNRIQVFYTHYGNDGDDYGHFHCKTIMITNDGKYEQAGEKLITINLGNEDYYPDKWHYMNLDAAYDMVVQEDDALEYVSANTTAGTKHFQKIWMFYTDKEGTVRGCKFNSDVWQYIHGSFVYSYDLHDVEKYKEQGEDVKKYWHLLGISEGAPPVAVDWKKWEEHYNIPVYEPSEFEYERMETEERTFSTNEKSSVFVGFKAGGEEEVVDVDFKFTRSWETENENKHVSVKGSVNAVGLNEKSCKTGVLFYLVPSMERLTYGVFPWWVDYDDRIEEEAASIQYRMVNLGYDLHLEQIPLNDSIFGFDTTEINVDSMLAWQNNAPNRQWLSENISLASGHRLLEWSDGMHGGQGYLETKDMSSIKTIQENEWELSAAVGKPNFLKIQGGGSHAWGSSTEITTELETGMHFSYYNLIDSEHGPKVTSLRTQALLFAEPHENFWFTRYLVKGQKPWYIGYLVSDVELGDEEGIENPTVIEELKRLNRIVVYPNPSNGKLINIEVDDWFDSECLVKVFSASGVEIYNSMVDFSTSNIIDVEFDKQLSSGVYFVKILNNSTNGIMTKKFIVN